MSESPVLCGWCQQPAATEVITRPGRKNRTTAPACEDHAKSFEARGMKTTRSELEEKLERERQRKSWASRNKPWIKPS